MDEHSRNKALRQRIINELMLNPCYQAVIHDLKHRRPVIPHWDPATNNIGQMQQKSAQQEWHDLILAILNPQGDD